MNLSTTYHDAGYVAMPRLFPQEVLLAFYQMMQSDLQAAGRPMQSFTARGPLLRQPAIEIYAFQYAPMLTFLWGLTPRVADVVGAELMPTYAYFRAYQRGDVCRVHSDRQACEHSLSLTIAYGEDRPWALSVATERMDVPQPVVEDDFGSQPYGSVAMAAGDAFCTRARTIATAGSSPTPTAGPRICFCIGWRSMAAMPSTPSTGRHTRGLPRHAEAGGAAIATDPVRSGQALPICSDCAPLSGRAGPRTGSWPSGSLRKVVNSPLPSIEGPWVHRPSGAAPSREVT